MAEGEVCIHNAGTAFSFVLSIKPQHSVFTSKLNKLFWDTARQLQRVGAVSSGYSQLGRPLPLVASSDARCAVICGSLWIGQLL